MTVKELAEHFNIDRSTVTRHIGTLNIKHLSGKLSRSTADYPVSFDDNDVFLISENILSRDIPFSAEKHGMSLSLEYEVWRGMKQRCYNSKKYLYKRYGGRGISVCNEWRHSFNTFYRDMGNIPFKNAQIDRIDNNGNYEPDNCRWVTPAENVRNSNATKITFMDANEIRILACLKVPQKEIGLEYGISYDQVSLIARLKSWKYKDDNGRYIA